MVLLNDLSVGDRVEFKQHGYVVVRVLPDCFVAKRFQDGMDVIFRGTSFEDVSLSPHYDDVVFVAVDFDGSPSIYPTKPVRDGNGDWVCSGDKKGTPISWALMLKLVGCPLTYADAPVQLQ